MTKIAIHARLTVSLVAALLLAGAAPPSPAQRRRAARRQPQPAAPRPAATPRPQAPARPNEPAKELAAEPRQQQQRPETDLPVEEILAEDSYGVYAEVRRVGQVVEGEEMKMALGAVRLIGDAADRKLADLAAFVSENSEPLSEALVSVAAMPTRSKLPTVLVSLKMASPREAAAFEPKLRAFLSGVLPPKAPAEGAARGARASRKPSERPKALAPGFVLRRAGSLLLAGDSNFTLKSLSGDGAAPLSQSVRFQSARNRFSSEQLFVYFDTTHVQEGWAVQVQKEQEERERRERDRQQAEGGGPGDDYDVMIATEPPPPPKPVAGKRGEGPAGEIPQTRSVGVVVTPPPAAGTGPAAEVVAGPQAEVSVVAPVGKVEDGGAGDGKYDAPPEAAPLTEEQKVAGRMMGVTRHLVGGIPRIPGTVAVALGLEGGSVALRVAVDNPPEGNVNVIPFLPNIVSGPPVTSETAAVAPADSDVFVNVSLDWERIFNSMMGTAASTEVMAGAGITVPTAADVIVGPSGEGDKPEEKRPTAEATVEAVEKIFGFKFKEDLIPALGNEVAVSMPSKLWMEPFRINRRSGPKAEEKDAEPGFVVLVALNDAEKVRKIFPRVLAALSFVAPGAPAAAERREGFDIQSAGGFYYAFIDNYLVLGGNIKSVRHVVDSRARNDTLAATNSYRDATAWQARQRLLHAYLSDALMRKAIEDTKKTAEASSDPLVQAMLARLDLQPEPASYSATNEGDVLLHELRLPVNLIKVYAAAVVIGSKESPVVTNEMMAVFALSRLRDAEDSFRDMEGKGRYGTLEELVAEELVEKGFAQHVEYKIELTAVGDRYEVVATPKSYGKTGRRSFYLDQSGIIRGADHKGQPAKPDDPPVD
ncbi:MAG TPA: DUF3352 domain-containing protein [Pyrinomonadaceae bacterium]|nr:DUF3352 domain-containing protein [Pyrinomonadaceae bacterium]